ncbi:MAG: type II toxin-antitoxin system VapC family toxin [Chloroflexi bacterium]|nr:type II toxin-antitoxin system VapC family toxin [Chloroflexota bacterium]MBK6712834.1 type II toxin-antitoxin system VapC family toxin [Chloroflexota bacterium]MBK7918749.1 type II toxin-antitoxin system VapC family toxin [Chloroflexota bacterium]MBP6806050.1 type II toxin-antitoxin system VapC family toxin [Chloroflexota bacterium]MBP7590329.1 type II toxin-antitoxin system VapC family toxin [Chloroflexota bacterium]
MNVVDSSGWLEYFADAPNAEFFAPAIENSPELLVPAISLYEVFKRVLQQVGEDKALEAVSFMMQGQVVELNALLAINAAKLSNQFKIPMADSIILATARHHDAVLWTQDADFATIPDVQYIPKDTI